MVDGVGSTAYKYHPGGRLATENGPWANDTVTYSLNSAGLVGSWTLEQPGGSTWYQSYGYDSAKRLASVTSFAGDFSYTYAGAGSLLAHVALPNGASIVHQHDTVARLTGTYLKKDATTVLNKYLYQYNVAAQRWQMTRSDNSTVSYTYDNLGQLTRALGSGGQSTENLGYGYDLAWNLNKRTNGTPVTTFNVDGKNQLTTVGSTTYGYDDNGNLTTETGGPGRTFTYDDENQLTAVGWGSGNYRTEFAYDGRGRSRKRTEKYLSGGQWVTTDTRYYIYDGMRVIQERNSANTPTVSYTRGSDLSGSREGAGGIGGLLARSDLYSGGSMTRHACYFADGNGNIVNLINAAAAHTVWATYRYNPYGATTYSNGLLASANVYRFSSKECIPNAGIYYYGFRFYDPNLQRWLNRDPIGERGGVNLYGFLKNHPLGRIDSFGFADYELPPGFTHYSPGRLDMEKGDWVEGEDLKTCKLLAYERMLSRERRAMRELFDTACLPGLTKLLEEFHMAEVVLFGGRFAESMAVLHLDMVACYYWWDDPKNMGPWPYRGRKPQRSEE
jgi:RHS repeat-associated protein